MERREKIYRTASHDSLIHDLAEGMDGILMERRSEFIQEGKYPSWLDRYNDLKRKFLADHPEYKAKHKNLPDEEIDKLMLEAQRQYESAKTV